MHKVLKSFKHMFRKVLNKVNRLIATDNKISSIEEENKKLRSEIAILKVLMAKYLANTFRKDHILESINEAEFKVFSQFGDDGIIQYLIKYLDISDSYFIEFGVENYSESLTRFLLINNNWSGLIMDGSVENIEYIKRDYIYTLHQLTAIHAFVDAENINSILQSEKLPSQIGLLHIDIDGNDYWVWKSINVIRPIIVVIEYNSVLGNERAITVPYKPDFRRTIAHYSNLYYGASLVALCILADKKGYNFIGCSSSGNNAYFVRKDKSKDLRALTAKEGYVQSKFREARNELGELIYTSGERRLEIIKGLPIYDIETEQLSVL